MGRFLRRAVLLLMVGAYLVNYGSVSPAWQAVKGIPGAFGQGFARGFAQSYHPANASR